jgi:inorganic pyrophosphatase
MSFAKVPLGNKSPDLINTIIEIPRGCSNKYEYNEETDTIELDRVIHSPMSYATDYGFVPYTRSEDGDHLDVMVIISNPTFPGCVIPARVVGLLDMEDEEGVDRKVLAVADKDPRYADVTDMSKVNSHLKKEIEHFFAEYKRLENGKWAKVKEWIDTPTAKEYILECKKRFEEES